MITGVDLIQEQIKVAMGERLTLKQEDIVFKVGGLGGVGKGVGINGYRLGSVPHSSRPSKVGA